MAPGNISELSLSDAVAFRVDFDGSVPPPWLRYWRGPVLTDFDGREWTMRPQRSTGSFVRAGRVADLLHRHARAALEALAVRARHARQPSANDRERRRNAAHRRRRRAHARPAAHVPAARHPAASLPAVVDVARPAIPRGAAPTLERDIEENLQLPDAGGRNNPKTVEFARELRSKHPERRGLHRRRARLVPPRIVLLHARASAARRQSGGRVPVRIAPRLLRALRERVRRDAARRGNSGARGHRLPGRHDQSERRLHDRAPVRRARLGGGPRRRTMAPPRSDRRRRAVAHPARPRRLAARGRARSAARAPRRHVPEVAAAFLGRDQSRLASQRDRLQFRPAARVVARMEAQRARAVADHRASSRRWRRRGSAGCSDGSRGGAAGRIARARCGTASARASLAPGCRAPRTKDRSTTSRARRSAGRSSRRRSASSATPTRSCATGRSPPTPTRRSSAPRRSGACAARCASCRRPSALRRAAPAAASSAPLALRAVPREGCSVLGRPGPHSNASRSSPRRFKRCRSFSSASAWICRTRSRVTPISRASSSSVATSRSLSP